MSQYGRGFPNQYGISHHTMPDRAFRAPLGGESAEVNQFTRHCSNTCPSSLAVHCPITKHRTAIVLSASIRLIAFFPPSWSHRQIRMYVTAR
jgi:hypothetical protein